MGECRDDCPRGENCPLGYCDLAPDDTPKRPTLENLLRMECDTVSVTGQDIVVVPNFRVAVQKKTDAGVHIIIHADDFDSDTLDFVVKGNELKPIW